MRLVIDLQGAQNGSRFRGIGRYSLSLTKALVRNRHQHEVVIALSGLFPETLDSLIAEFAALLPPENIRVWYGVRPVREAERANRLRRAMSETIREAFLASLKPDVVMITSLFEGFGDDSVGSIGLLNDTIPVAVILYDLIPLVSPDKAFKASLIRQAWYRRKLGWLRRSRKVLAISESSRQEALSTGFFQEDSVINISAACDDRFRVLLMSDEERRTTSRRFGITRPFVMYTGGADDRKNLHRLIESFAQLPVQVRAGHQLILAGKMPDRNVRNYLNTAKRHGLGNSDLILTGYMSDDDLIRLYNMCALFVFPSLHEGFGLPPLEAMACGAPVIGSNTTTLPEVIGLDEALFNPYSSTAITAKIARALTDEAFRTRLIAHGNTHYRLFSWDKSARTAWHALADFGNADRARPDIFAAKSAPLGFL